MSTVQCRPADLSDIPAIARIRTLGSGEGGAPADRMARYLQGEHHPQHALPPRVIYVALEAESLVGYIAGHLTRRYACDGELQWIYVSPERRRQGIASELLRRLAAWFAELQAFRICVNVDPADTPALRFYTHHAAVPLNEHWLVWKDLPAALKRPVNTLGHCRHDQALKEASDLPDDGMQGPTV